MGGYTRILRVRGKFVKLYIVEPRENGVKVITRDSICVTRDLSMSVDIFAVDSVCSSDYESEVTGWSIHLTWPDVVSGRHALIGRDEVPCGTGVVS